MKTWMLPWLFPVGLLGAVVFVVVFGKYAPFAAIILGWLLVPVLWRVHFPSSDDDADTRYWRISRR
jgi:hypothetical protein